MGFSKNIRYVKNGLHMENKKHEYKSIDEYIHSFPENIQKKLEELREAIKEQAPQAQEKISYQMPTFFLNGNLVHFAAYSNHIGFYPTSSGIDAFKNEISKYKNAKGSVQFPLEEPLPIELIKKIVKFRVEENINKKKRQLMEISKP
jgi:uncharacterized protein YdhG (YjbR/CyaY superfamily)